MHTVTSCYGEQRTITDLSGKTKTGITYATDLRAGEGTPLYAVGEATIIETKYNEGDCGNKILYLLSDEKGAVRYCHLSEILVAQGQKVSKSQIIGKAGSTGFVTAPHLDVKWYPNYPDLTSTSDFLCLIKNQEYTFKQGVYCEYNESCPVFYS